jgi:aminoglycoside N3'-acetyltransferase
VRERDIRAAARKLGVGSLPVCVHASLRSFGIVEAGADTVIDALLAEGCTVMAPTFTEAFAVAPPSHRLLPRNGWTGGESLGVEPRREIYAPDTTAIDRDMGAIPAALVRREGRVRGNHPLDSFTALGPLATELISPQTSDDVYAPFRVLAEHGGFVLLMGVGLTRMTLLHEAERVAGRTLFRRWAPGPDGEPTMATTGGCSEGFDAFEPYLRVLARETRVGASRWRAFPAEATIAAAAAAIRGRPDITHCRNPSCTRCDDAIAGGPILPG